MSKYYVESTSDIDILFKMKKTLEKCLGKEEDSACSPDVFPLSKKFPILWPVFLDKRYQGATEFVRAVNFTKKPKNEEFSGDVMLKNKSTLSNRIIVENYFGRQCSLWHLMFN